MLNTWGTCSLKAKFNYIDKLPTQTGSSAHFGSCVHSAIEQLHLGKTLNVALKVFVDEFNGTIPDYWNRRTNYDAMLANGQAMIREYYETRAWNDSYIVAAEHSFMVDIGEHTLSGIVDYIEYPKSGGKLIIGDLKTGFRPKWDTIHLLLQFTAYDYASKQPEFWMGHPSNLEKYPPLLKGEELYEKMKDVPRELIWYDLKKNEAINVGPRTEKDYARMYRCMEQIDRAIEKEVFVPTVSAEGCTFCDFKDICPVYWDAEEE